MEAHGGRIWAESEGVGQGSRFTFTLPVAEGVVAEPIRPAVPAAARRNMGEQGRILVVDDDPIDPAPRAGRPGQGRLHAPWSPGTRRRPCGSSAADRPRLALLDLLLPGDDGIELMGRMLRIADVPVVFLSAYNRDEVIARALEAGAVDYIVKPFSSTELVARVRAALRRRVTLAPIDASQPFVLGDLVLDYAQRAVSVAGRPVRLTPTEYGLLFELSVNAGRVLTFEHLLGRVWGPDHSGGRGSVRTYVKRLRRKLGEDAGSPRYIFPEPRVGYRLGQPETPVEETE